MRNFQVWYQKPEFFQSIVRPTVDASTTDSLSQTHTMVAVCMAETKEDVFRWMQGENWSPNGEANPLVRSLGLSHTSMMIGDVLTQASGKAWILDHAFWESIN